MEEDPSKLVEFFKIPLAGTFIRFSAIFCEILLTLILNVLNKRSDFVSATGDEEARLHTRAEKKKEQ